MGLEIECHVNTLIKHSTGRNGDRHQILQLNILMVRQLNQYFQT